MCDTRKLQGRFIVHRLQYFSVVDALGLRTLPNLGGSRGGVLILTLMGILVVLELHQSIFGLQVALLLEHAHGYALRFG